MVRRAADARSASQAAPLVARMAFHPRACFLSPVNADDVARVCDAVLLLMKANSSAGRTSSCEPKSSQTSLKLRPPLKFGL